MMIPAVVVLLLALRGVSGVTTSPSAAPTSQRSPKYTMKLLAGTGTATTSGNGGFATAAGLNNPRSVWLDSTGLAYIAEGSCVRTIDSSNIIQAFAGNCGSTGTTGIGGKATSALLLLPVVMFATTDGKMYIGDFVANAVRLVDSSSIISKFAGTGTAGTTGNGGKATSADIYGPYSVWQNTVGLVYIASYHGHMIRAVSTSSIITAFAGTGTQSFSGDGGAATSCTMNHPQRAISDTTGQVYTSESTNNRVRFVSTSGIITTKVGTGSTTYNGENLAGTSTNVFSPAGLMLDSANGDLYYADFGLLRVFVLTGSTKLVTTFIGSGNYGSTGDGGAATSAAFMGIDGVYFDQNSATMYLSDMSANKIRVAYNTNPTMSPTIAPTLKPSVVPSIVPSRAPTASPTLKYLSIRSSPSYTVTNALAFAGITSGGAVLCWGASSTGGDCSSVSGSLKNVVEVVSSKNAFVALTSTGSVVAWGTASDISGWSDATSGVVIASVTASERAFAGVSGAGAVVAFGVDCCGGNVDQYGAWSSLYLSSDVSSVQANAAAFCALKTDGSVYCWGSAFAGGGVSSVSRSDLSDIVLLSSTRSAFAGVKSDGSVVVWGNSKFGGSLTEAVSSLLDSDTTLHIVSNPVSFTAYTADHSLVSWGAVSGAMAMGSEVKYIAHTSQAFAAVRNNGSVVSWGDASAEGGVALSENVTEIVGNNAAFAAVLYDGSVSVWGDSDWGGSGSLSTTLVNITSVYCTSRAFAAVDGSGGVTAWGSSGAGGTVSSGVSDNVKSDVRLVCANDMAFTAIKNDGSAYAWGNAKSASGAVEGNFTEVM